MWENLGGVYASHPRARVLGVLPATAPQGWRADDTESPTVVLSVTEGLPDAGMVAEAASSNPAVIVVLAADPVPTSVVVAALLGQAPSWPGEAVADVDARLAQAGYAWDREPSPRAPSVVAGGLVAAIDQVRSEVGLPGEGRPLVRTYVSETARSQPGHDDGAPFLSVLVRTQATPRRLETLVDVLACLQGQTDDDFEVLVLAHDPAPEGWQGLLELVQGLPAQFRGRVQAVEVLGGGRAAGLVEGHRRARGAYLAALDDDDLVLGHWVQTFRELAVAAGRPTVLRACAVAQAMELLPLSPAGFRAVAPVEKRWMSTFDLVSHLVDNHSPIHSWALSRQAHVWNLRWDTELPVLEDWDLLLRSALRLGVASSPEITAVYRVWPHAENSFAELPEASWGEVRTRVLDGLDSSAVALAPGSATRLRDLEFFALTHRPFRVRVKGYAARRLHRSRVALAGTPVGPPVKKVLRALRAR